MKKPRHFATALIIAAAVVPAAFVGCEGAATSSSTPAPETASVLLPADLFTETSSHDAITLVAARSTVEPGDVVTISGRVGGRAAPFISERAVFTLADESLEFCGAECGVPWDACCVPSEEIAAKSSTVQVVDAAGNPLRIGLEGRSGLSPASRVTIRGTVAEGHGDAFVINASQIHVVDESPGA
jgi:hypothetical protein